MSANHEEFVDGLEITSPSIKQAFLKVDRAKFFPSKVRCRPDFQPYIDSAVRKGVFHQSAPHIYSSALWAFNLDGEAVRSNRCDCLVIGSGTGYFVSILSTLLNSDSVIHGIDINDQCVEFAREAHEAWRCEYERFSSAQKLPRVEFFHGDGYKIDPNRNTHYDMIYIAAGAPPCAEEHFLELLRLNGVLVGPFGNSFLKIIKDIEGDTLTHELMPVQFAPLSGDPLLSIDERNRNMVLSLCPFAPNKRKFQESSETFRKAVRTILLAKVHRDSPVSELPQSILYNILSFCPRNWFDVALSEVEFLKALLAKEREARKQLEKRLEQVENERDRAQQFWSAMSVHLGGRLGVVVSNRAHTAQEEEDSDASFE